MIFEKMPEKNSKLVHFLKNSDSNKKDKKMISSRSRKLVGGWCWAA